MKPNRARRALAAVAALATAMLGGLVGGMALPTGPAAADVPAAFTDTQVATGFSAPTAMAFAPDGRIFVAEQGGRLRVIENGVLLAAPFLTVSTTATGERGLLGVAFDPDFATNHFVYVYYTATTPAVHNRRQPLHRRTATSPWPAARRSCSTSTTCSAATNHNGGAIHFGPDGKLYVAVGENANGAQRAVADQPARQDPAHQPRRHASRPTTRSSTPATGDEPGHLGARPAQPVHLRVPARHRPDVHQRRRPEHLGGDQRRRRRVPTTAGRPPRGRPRSRASVHRSSPTGTRRPRSVRHHRRGVLQPADGAPSPPTTSERYFFADYCAGFDPPFDPDTGADTGFATDLDSPVDLAVGVDGNLYYLARGSGSVLADRIHRAPRRRSPRNRQTRSSPPVSRRPSR